MSKDSVQIGSTLRDAAGDPKPGDYRPYVNQRAETEPTEVQVGTKLRDAAVDPRLSDYLPRLNPGTPPPSSGAA